MGGILAALCITGYFIIGLIVSLAYSNDIHGLIIFFWPLFLFICVLQEIVYLTIKFFTNRRNGGRR